MSLIINDEKPIIAIGHILITDPDTGEEIINKRNAIHLENMSLAIVKSFSGNPEGQIQEMHFGNGGSIETGGGTITYLEPNVTGPNASLYNPTYYKVINDRSNLNTDPINNNIRYVHTTGSLYSDIVITCTLDYNEPSGQNQFDTVTLPGGDYEFDELGLKAYSSVPGAGPLLTHVVFNPTIKTANRRIKVQYVIRFQLSST